jgi:hypothetical protein
MVLKLDVDKVLILLVLDRAILAKLEHNVDCF